jgi:hypothetical protein
MLTILKMYPFKGTDKLSELFDMNLWGHEQAGRGTYPSKQFLRGIIPLFTNFRGILDPSLQTSLNKLLQGIIPL